MILKDPKTNALLNITAFESIQPIDLNSPFKSKILMVAPTLNAGWYETTATVDELLNYLKEKRFFVVATWKQKWS